MLDNESIILELLKDLKKGQEEQAKEQRDTSDAVKDLKSTVSLELQKINKLDEEQNTLLAEHAKRSDQLERKNDLLEARIFGSPEMSSKQRAETLSGRIEVLEEPGKWWKMTKKKIIGLAGLLTALGAILKFFGLI